MEVHIEIGYRKLIFKWLNLVKQKLLNKTKLNGS